MRGFGFFLGFSRGGGGAAGWIGYLLNALGFATSGEQTLTAPDPVLALDWEGTLTDFGGAVNEDGVDVSAIPGSRLSAGVVYDDDGSGNPLHPSVTTGGVTDYVFYPARENNEPVTSEDYRTSGSGVGEYYYSNQELASPASTSLTEPLRDSDGRLYEERVRNGGFDVDAEWTKDAQWTIAGGVAHCDGTSSLFITQSNVLTVGHDYEITFTVLNHVSGSFRIRNIGGVAGTYRSADGTYTEIITAATANLDMQGASTSVGDIDNVSVVEVNSDGIPTNVLDGGRREAATNLLTYSGDMTNAIWSSSGLTPTATELQETTASSTHSIYTLIDVVLDTAYTTTFILKENVRSWVQLRASSGFDSINTWVNFNISTGEVGYKGTGDFGYSITEGSDRKYHISLTAVCILTRTAGIPVVLNLIDVDTNSRNPSYAGSIGDGVYYYGSQSETGTEATEYIPTVASTVTEAENVDESVLWTYEGRYGLSGQRVEFAESNYLLNSDSPATQTTGSLTTGTYTCWIEDGDTGSATVSAGTATITGGGAASDGSDLTFEVTGAGTVTVTVAGTVTFFQLEGGNFRTSHIVTVGSTITRSAVNLTIPTSETGLTAAEGAGRMIFTNLQGSGTIYYILAARTDNDNKIYMQMRADGRAAFVYEGQNVGTTATANPGGGTNGSQFVVDFQYSLADGLKVSSAILGETPDIVTAAGPLTELTAMSPIVFIGSYDGTILQYPATYDSVKFYPNAAAAAADLDDWSL